ncbi:RHS repeat-associated core domain-containing protein [Bordetella bronchialis]|uniref:RHS repeat-associated core domain-containing protein n=1 Tax=Bordetella bronchialis TaxID=463025 RepID=A0A193FUI6_9BORD|nr:RHS repeat-associated core domain-containing protein [Bordetella bronchialis]ANN71417.1 hypothetical protein BAU08_08820 [Bordetella bronchialis]
MKTIATRHNAIAYAAQYRSPVSAAYPLGNGYRLYLPSLMRFNRPDDMSPFAAGGIHAYAYCVGDPVNRTDPRGRYPILTFASMVMTLVDMATSASAYRNASTIGSDLVRGEGWTARAVALRTAHAVSGASGGIGAAVALTGSILGFTSTNGQGDSTGHTKLQSILFWASIGLTVASAASFMVAARIRRSVGNIEPIEPPPSEEALNRNFAEEHRQELARVTLERSALLRQMQRSRPPGYREAIPMRTLSRPRGASPDIPAVAPPAYAPASDGVPHRPYMPSPSTPPYRAAPADPPPAYTSRQASLADLAWDIQDGPGQGPI